MLHAKYLIVGGGDAGAAIARLILQRGLVDQPEEVKIIDARPNYIFQSGQTLVALGFHQLADIVRPLRSRLPRYAVHLQTNVYSVTSGENSVYCEDGRHVSYDELILAAGLESKFNIPGLEDALFNPAVPVSSCYVPALAPKYEKLMKNFKGGRAVFCQPPPPVKCAGATQKVMYVSADNWRRLDRQIEFHTPEEYLLSVKYYDEALRRVAKGYKIDTHFGSKLVEVRGKEQVAVFETAQGLSEVRFDILHASPSFVAPQFIRRSNLNNLQDFADVDPRTLRHLRVPNVWAVGDCAGLPVSKTLSAVSEQVHVLAENLQAVRLGRPLMHYNGYTACPMLVDRRRVLLAEYGYEGRLMPSLHQKPRPSLLAGFLYKYVFRITSLYGLNIHMRSMRQRLAAIARFLRL